MSLSSCFQQPALSIQDVAGILDRDRALLLNGRGPWIFSGAALVLLHQHIRVNIQDVIRLTDHFQGKLPLAVHDLARTALKADHFSQILLLHAHLFHPEPDGFDGVGHRNGKVVLLTMVYKHTQDLQFIPLLAAELGIKDLFKPAEGMLMVISRANGCDVHVRSCLRRSCRIQHVCQ